MRELELWHLLCFIRFPDGNKIQKDQMGKQDGSYLTVKSPNIMGVKIIFNTILVNRLQQGIISLIVLIVCPLVGEF